MSLYYRGIQAKVPNKEEKKLWYPILVKTGEMIDSQKIAKKVARLTTVHEGDLHNVIRALTEVMRDELLNGHSVRLDGLGTFTLRIRSRGNGVEKEENVNAAQINSIICQFTPEYNRTVYGGTTRSMYEGVTFKHINQRLPKNYLNNSGNQKEDDDDGEYIDPMG